MTPALQTPLLLLGVLTRLVVPGPSFAAAEPMPPPPPPVLSADVFQYPLPTWQPHCLAFGSEWRICKGTVLRACPSGAVWLHTGVDVQSDLQPVMAAGDGVLIRHSTSEGVVITQYWHVWLRAGFRVGTPVTRGEVFADVADMGAQTHLHFAVFKGDYEPHAWNGALPPTACSGFPAFPYRFIEPNAFIEGHLPQ